MCVQGRDYCRTHYKDIQIPVYFVSLCSCWLALCLLGSVVVYLSVGRCSAACSQGTDIRRTTCALACSNTSRSGSK